MHTESISQQQARRLVLACQGLHKNQPFGSASKGVLQAVEQLSYIQIDSISVVARAHHHTLWNRVNSYSETLLEQLIEQKKIFEYWSHAAAYLPMCDYRFSLYRKQAIAAGEKHWHDKDQKLTQQILQRIRLEGPLQAKDFEREGNKKAAGWWDWKPAKKALEQLFMEGELMAVQRRGFQKVYDLSERVLPEGTDTRVPCEQEFCDYLILRFLRANGLATVSEIAYLRKGIKNQIATRCLQLLEDGDLQQLNCQGQHYYALGNCESLLTTPIKKHQVKILSPFDNLLIQRKRTQQLFDFDYQIECYVPESKRQYGYFCLPLLWGSEFVGRMDAKIERKNGVLQIQHLHLHTPKVADFIEDFIPALKAFLVFNQGNRIAVKRISAPADTAQTGSNVYQQVLEGLTN